MMGYILLVLILLASSDGVQPGMAFSVTADFNTLDACWAANDKVVDPVRNVHPDAETYSSCASKGLQNVGG